MARPRRSTQVDARALESLLLTCRAASPGSSQSGHAFREDLALTPADPTDEPAGPQVDGQPRSRARQVGDRASIERNEWTRFERRPQRGQRAAWRVVAASRWSVCPCHHTRSTRTPATVGKNSLVNMAILPFPRDTMPLEPQGTAISGASKAPMSHFLTGSYRRRWTARCPRTPVCRSCPRTTAGSKCRRLIRYRSRRTSRA